MGSANNIIHPTRLREIGSSVRRFERVMMSVRKTPGKCLPMMSTVLIDGRRRK
jgi:hypothetical protein